MNITDPFESIVAITRDDSNDLAKYTRGIFCGTGGLLHVTTVAGEEVTISGIVAGEVYPFKLRRIYLTGTTASGIFGLY